MGTDNQLIAKQYRVQVHKTLVSSFWVPFRGRMKGHLFSHLYVGPYLAGKTTHDSVLDQF